jgi:hypothetical protein
MSTYGRAWDSAVRVLEDYGIDWMQKHDGYQDAAGNPMSLADAVTDTIYEIAVEFGRRVEREKRPGR